MVECLHKNLTQSHLNILEVFVSLATSHYSKVLKQVFVQILDSDCNYFPGESVSTVLAVPDPEAVSLLLLAHPGQRAGPHQARGGQPRAVQGRPVHHPPEPVPHQAQLDTPEQAVARHRQVDQHLCPLGYLFCLFVGLSTVRSPPLLPLSRVSRVTFRALTTGL